MKAGNAGQHPRVLCLSRCVLPEINALTVSRRSTKTAALLRRTSLSATSLEDARPAKVSRRDYSDFAFVTFFAAGDQGDSGHTCATSRCTHCHSCHD